MKTKICEKGEKCSHFLIEKLVRELGGLGSNDFRIKSRKEFRKWKQKIKELICVVEEFEREVIEFFDAKGFYPCVDPMQIAWGRKKYQVCVANLIKKKAYLKTRMEVKK